jgi:signal transduction histidine kinase
VIEPKAPAPQRRLMALKDLAAEGIETGVFLMPVLPGLTDGPGEVEALAAAAAAAGPGVTLTNAVPGNLPPILGDPVSLRRILDNLLRNALESLPPRGGLVTVDGALEKDEDFGNPVVLLTVSDSGAGIPPGDLDRIFQDFFTTKPQGTGLGLSNVRRLAGDLGGSVKVASQPGRGTTFTLSFPLPEA